MRFLGIGDTCDLGALYMRLVRDGHEVRVHVAEPLAQGTMAGLVDHTANWENELDWVRGGAGDGIILFENVAKVRGELQDRLRRDGFKVIGGSAYGDRLENDRAYAQRVLSDLGLRTASVHEFSSVADAVAFVTANPSRYVLKFNGGAFRSSSNYVGRMPDGRDAIAVLRAQTAGMAPGEPLSFVLMQHVEGVEMGVGAYFDGERFVGRACLDWEHKRFFPGDLGELTGEMGTVATFERSDSFFERTLQRMTSLLRDGRYCGYINLNTIVNEDGIWPLEFTCRFGYPGYAVLGPLQNTRWGDLFAAMAHRRGTVTMDPGFSVAIVVTTPPFPYDRGAVEEEVGVPVIVTEPLTAAEQEGLYLGEVGMADGQLVTSGKYGWTLVAAGIGPDIAAARQAAYGLAGKFVIPNARYRADIGARLLAGDFRRVEAMGYLG
jgi:phosphoribosylamine--glycine ligase